MRIIHISDLHYRKDWDEEVGLVFRKFVEDLRAVYRENETILIFSGDLVQSGQDESLYLELLDKLSTALDGIGITSKNRFAIPGNHDVSQEDVTSRFLSHLGSIRQIEDETSFNNAIAGELKTVLFPKFGNFKAFATKFTEVKNEEHLLVGGGVDLDPDMGIYFLNTAITSHGGIKDTKGRPIDDKRLLAIETRNIHKWIQSSSSKTKILVMHHPLSWLMPWAEEVLEQIIQEYFDLVISGHVHLQNIAHVREGIGGALYCSGPPLFTRKKEVLGYTIIDILGRNVTTTYRQWRHPSGFVLGTLMAGNDSGTLEFSLESTERVLAKPIEKTERKSTIDILRKDFEDAATSYSSYRGIWIEREFSKVPENASKGTNSVIEDIDALIERSENLLIRSPHEFGLTSVGRQFALRYAEKKSKFLVFLKISDIQPHKSAVEDAINAEIERIGIDSNKIDGFILDDFENSKKSKRFLKSLEEILPKSWVIALSPREDIPHLQILNNENSFEGFLPIYLWTLSRQAVRRLVETYGSGCKHLDEDALARKVVADLDSLNMPRTAINCLTLIKINEQESDDSPVNRTEMIRKVFSLFFTKFDGIPRYASKPDLLDCEYALGVFCEYLIKQEKSSFSKAEFFERISAYSKIQILNIESDVLFLILVSEGIITRRADKFEFRFAYWLYYFAAHRMHHSKEFADYVFSEKRYAAWPLVMEFYSGLDRRRSDAVKILIRDLKSMEIDFRERSGIPVTLNPYGNARWAPDKKPSRRWSGKSSKG